jgi:hypothetical protein
MSSQQNILDLVVASNPSAALLTLSDVTFSLPTASTDPSKNTQVTLTVIPSRGYSGAITIYYNRKNLANFGTNLSFIQELNFSLSDIVSELNVLRNSSLTVADINSLETTVSQNGDFKTFLLTAKEDSLEWIGSLEITVLTRIANTTTEETVLASVFKLQDRITDLENIGFVTEVAGFSGVITKIQLGIDKVDNVRDLDKPISLAQATVNETKLDNGIVFITRNNISNDDLVLGNVVYSFSDTEVDKANSKFETKKIAIGLVADNLVLSQGGVCKIQTTGILTGTLNQWEAVTGMVGGLVVNSRYFLDTISGKLTPYMPSDAISLCPVGKAISQTEFSINIETIINL